MERFLRFRCRVPTPSVSSALQGCPVASARGSLWGMIDVSARGGEGVGRARAWLALCEGGGMQPLLTRSNQSSKRLYSPCQGELVGRVMGQGEMGLRENIQRSLSE